MAPIELTDYRYEGRPEAEVSQLAVNQVVVSR